MPLLEDPFSDYYPIYALVFQVVSIMNPVVQYGLLVLTILGTQDSYNT
jgi:hypothetical protein